MLIAGASGHALEILDVLLENNMLDPVAFFDDCTSRDPILGEFSVLKDLNDAREWLRKDSAFCLGVGNPASRKILVEKLSSVGGVHQGIRSLKSEVSRYVDTIDPTADVLKRVFISSRVKIGCGALINTGAQIHHEVKIGEFCEIGPASIILGNVSLGNSCQIGAGAVLLPKVTLCNDVIVGAGAVVTESISFPGVYVGIPAKKLEK